jgi:hypothetical protein
MRAAAKGETGSGVQLAMITCIRTRLNPAAAMRVERFETKIRTPDAISSLHALARRLGSK